MHSSATSQPSSANAPTPDELPALIEEITSIRQLITTLEADYKRALDRLSAAHDAGTVLSTFTVGTTAFKLNPGRQSWDYDPNVVAQVKALQEFAKDNGMATAKVGSPFWTLRAVKPKA